MLLVFLRIACMLLYRPKLYFLLFSHLGCKSVQIKVINISFISYRIISSLIFNSLKSHFTLKKKDIGH